MFTDPIVVTINAVAKSMARTQSSGTKSLYSTADGLFTMTLSHTAGANGRIRTMARLDQKAIVTNPLDSTNDYDILSFYTVTERPAFGFSLVQLEQQIVGYETWLDSAAIAKLYGQEH